jgi:hypothetical protein
VVAVSASVAVATAADVSSGTAPAAAGIRRGLRTLVEPHGIRAYPYSLYAIHGSEEIATAKFTRTRKKRD